MARRLPPRRADGTFRKRKRNPANPRRRRTTTRRRRTTSRRRR